MKDKHLMIEDITIKLEKMSYDQVHDIYNILHPKSYPTAKELDQLKIDTINEYKNSGNQKLHSVKWLKDRTGWGLKESKDFLEDAILDMNFELKLKLKELMHGV